MEVHTDIDAILDALGDATRRRIVSRLATGPLGVGEIADGMPVGRPAVSMHLRVLKDAGLVRDLAEGNRRVYHLEPKTLQRLRDHLDWYWERSLAAFQEAAETRAKEKQMAVVAEVLVAKTVRVNAPLALAFDVFVEHGWWPVATHHIAEKPGIEAILEPFQGGRWYERAADGTETDWGVVVAWQPPYRILLTWQVSPQWTYEAEALRGSEVEVTFSSEGPDVTRVDLVHRRLERYGPETDRMRRILEEKGGNPLDAYARHVAEVVRQRSRTE
jgi:DNA-binding transcriptional ArsR family regulator